jgi:hypothetical protein
MTALCPPGRAVVGRLCRLSALMLLIAFAWPANAEPVFVTIDQARIVRLPQRTVTVVIGNPLIADVSVQPSGVAIITGKGHGATNIIAMDKAGAVLMEKDIEVGGPPGDTVVVYRGPTRETYSCTPQCSPRITLGDEGEFFDKALSQTTTLNTQASSAANSAH